MTSDGGAMNEIVAGIISLLVGCTVLLWRESLARYTIEEQNRFWGFEFGEREVKRTKIIAVAVGTGFVILGLLFLSGTWEFRS